MNKVMFCAISLTALILSGCSSIPVVYTPPAPVVQKPVADSLLISEIVDARPEMDEFGFYSNADPWLILPIIPYSKQTLKPSTRHNYFQNELKDALLRLFVKDLNASGLFTHLNAADANNPNLKPNIGAYNLKLTIKKGVWNRYLTAYCLSYAGNVLWGVGLPVSYGNVELEVLAELRNSQGQVIATETLSEKVGCTEWIFEQIAYSPCVSENIMTEIFPELAKKLRLFLQKSIP